MNVDNQRTTERSRVCRAHTVNPMPRSPSSLERSTRIPESSRDLLVGIRRDTLPSIAQPESNALARPAPSPPPELGPPHGVPLTIDVDDVKSLLKKHGAPVMSGALKLVLPVSPMRDAEKLVYPDSHPRAGHPIVDWDGKLIGDSGIVFYNAEDQSHQACVDNGLGVIIMNEVSQEQARRLLHKVRSYEVASNELTLKQLKSILEFAADLGITDCYNSNRHYIATNLKCIEGIDGDEDFGMMIREDKELCKAIHVPCSFKFRGPAMTEQLSGDGVILKQGKDYRAVQTHVFERTYFMLPDRTFASVEELPRFLGLKSRRTI